MPVCPFQALSACGEEDLTMINRWWKVDPLDCSSTEMVWKHIEVGGSMDFTRTASTEVERSRLVMALAVSNRTLPSLLVVVTDS